LVKLTKTAATFLHKRPAVLGGGCFLHLYQIMLVCLEAIAFSMDIGLMFYWRCFIYLQNFEN